MIGGFVALLEENYNNSLKIHLKRATAGQGG